MSALVSTPPSEDTEVRLAGVLLEKFALDLSLSWLDRRSAQTTSAGGDEKEAVKGYFNSVGFERWNKIYGTTDEISSVSFFSSDAALALVHSMQQAAHFTSCPGMVSTMSVIIGPTICKAATPLLAARYKLAPGGRIEIRAGESPRSETSYGRQW